MAGVVIGSEQFVYDNAGKLACSLEFNSEGRQTRKTTFLHQTEENRAVTISEVDGKFAGRVVEGLRRKAPLVLCLVRLQ